MRTLAKSLCVRWPSVNARAGQILCVPTKDHIHKLKDSHFIEGKHYFKKVGRVLFDKLELDNWVKTSYLQIKPKEIVENILKDLI